MQDKTWWQLLLSPKFFVITLLGFSSGLPLALVSSTLEARYAASSVDLTTIGIVSMVGLPYVLKFLWAPLLDKISMPLMGRRRGWMLLMQLLLAVGLMYMAVIDVEASPYYLALVALLVAVLAATQDIAIDAYRTDILLPEERGVGMGFFVGAYRLAVLISGSLALLLVAKIGWQWTYMLMAACMVIGILGTIIAERPETDNLVPTSFASAFIEPIKDFMRFPGAWVLLALIIAYKFGDSFAARLVTTFYIRGLDFTLAEIGTVSKVGGFFAMLLGVFLGGLLLTRLTLFRALVLFGFCQAFSNLMFVWLAIIGKSMPLFVATVMIEQVCSGMGNAAFIALLMGLCNKQFSAAQYALFSAISAIPREVLGPLSVYLVKTIGWQHYYEVTFLCSFPALLLLWWLKSMNLSSQHQELLFSK